MTMKDLQSYIDVCEKCELYKTRNAAVLGDGNPSSEIMLIGEGPGEQEDLTGKAFVLKAGQLLDKMMACIGLDRTNTYICNIVKCRPPQNRNPNEDEIQNCIDYLRHQFCIMRPKIVVLLGSIACRTILDRNFSIMKRHGEVVEKQGTVFISTFHPSALLHDPSKKILAFSDLKIIQKEIQSRKINI